MGKEVTQPENQVDVVLKSSPLSIGCYPRNASFIAGSLPEEDILLTDGDNNSRFGEGDEYYGGGNGGRPPLSPVSEHPAEYMEDDEEVMMYEMMEAGVPAPPDGGWGWVIVFASFMCNLIVDGIAYTFGVFLGYFAAEFIPEGEPTGKVAWVGSLLTGVYLLVGPIVSALTNKFGCRAVCITGSIVGTIGFLLSSFSPSLSVLMITYGVIGGIGFGLIYLPAVVCVGYYFESRRALATGIAVCGSGVGTFVFAPVAKLLLSYMNWRHANRILAALVFCCGIFGALMRPLELKREPLQDDEGEDSGKQPKNKPLLLRMAEDKKNQLEKGSMAGSAYFMVQLPDGTMEKRMKLPLNVDPGVHSSFNLDQLVPGTPITPNPTLLPTITEGKTKDGTTESPASSEEIKIPVDLKEEDEKEDESRPLMSTTPAIPIPIPEVIAEEREDGSADSMDDAQLSASAAAARRRNLRRNSEGVYSISPGSITKTELLSKSPPRVVVPIGIGRSGSVAAPYSSRMGGIPRNGSAPQFTPGRSIPKNGSVPLFDRVARKHSYRAVPLGSVRPSSKTNLSDSRRGSGINQFSANARNNNIGTQNQDEDYSSLWSRGELSEGLIFSTSHRGSAQMEPRHIIRPLSRKDIFYSGSIANLPEYQSQKSLNSYRQSVLNIPRLGSQSWRSVRDDGDGGEGGGELSKTKPSICPCWGRGAGSGFLTAFSQLMDCRLITNPVFLFIAVSNVFGMLGFYVPFVYIMDSAIKQGVEEGQAAFLLSVIGIANTIGRVVIGLISDLPQVNSLFLNNMCLLLSGICVGAIPFCSGYYSYVVVSIFFGLFVSGYVSLTSIILVDLLGLENLTNAFGLLILFRGAASIVGAPLAGAVLDAFHTYEIPFFMAGSFLIVSAIISFMVPCVRKFGPEKKILQPPTFIGGYLEDIPEAAESSSPNESMDSTPTPGDEKKEKFEEVESVL